MVLILGNYINFDIKTSRGLPAFNPAASNRMFRLAQSFKSVDEEVMIVSSACAMRMKWTGKISHKSKIETFENIKIYFCSTIGLPFLGMLFEQVNVLFTIWKLSRLYKVNAMLVYCYYPSSVWASLFSKYILHIKIIEDLEDVCVPKLSDWKSKTEANPIQQLIGWFLMKIMVLFSDAIIIPTSNFLPFINKKKNIEIISGCIEVPSLNEDDLINFDSGKIRVLFSGALEDENGIPLFIDFLKILDKNPEISKNYIFDISGHGSKAIILKEELSILKNIDSNFYGFLTEEEYIELLDKIKIALVLQNPNGRYALLKTPSKGYEYMSNAKMVIVSNIGDFGQLPKDTCFLLQRYDTESLYEIFANLSKDLIIDSCRKAFNYSLKNWDSRIVGIRLKKLI